MGSGPAVPADARVLVVRLDSAGDVLICGPAVRAVAASSRSVTMLCGPRGAAAARLLPGIDDVLVWRAPWIDPEPQPVRADDIAGLVGTLSGRYDAAIVLTSFHQSALPTALILRLAGVRHVTAISEDYPGSLLDVRHRVAEDLPEPVRALSTVEAAGYRLPPDDDGRLSVRRPLPVTDVLTGPSPYVVLHPGTSVPARAWPPDRWRDAARALVQAGHHVVVTGAPDEQGLTSSVAGDHALDLGGRTTLTELAGVLDHAAAVVVANTGPAHLAAAVGSPVVSIFAPTVPAERWQPYGVPLVLLGDQSAPCRDSRAAVCPVAGHPCLTSVTACDVVHAVNHLVSGSAAA
jgi:ADP-heptose:LPS heptosyltransferase